MTTADENALLAASGQWQRTSPLAALYFLALALRRQVLNLGQFVGTLAVFLFLVRQGPVATIAGAAGLLTLFLVLAALRYWFFRFRLDAQRVLIRQGVLRKTELELQFDRVQGVTVEQPLMFRWLGLVTVGFDTAGSTQQEGRLPAVKPDFAAALRARVEGAKRAATAEPAAVAAPSEPSSATESDPDGQAVLRLDNGEIIRIGLADRSVLAVLAVVPLMWGTLDNTLRDQVSESIEDVATSFAQLGIVAAGVVATGGLLLLAAALAAISVAMAFLRYHGFTLFEAQGGESLRTRRGLLTRKAMAVDRVKIQQVQLSQTLLMRFFSRFRLYALPAAVRAVGASEEGGVAASVLHVPMLGPEQVRSLADRIFAGEDAGLSLLPAKDSFVRISPVYIRARAQAVGVAPAVLALVALYPFVGAASLLCLGWPLLVALCAWQLWRRRAYMHNDSGLSYRAGLLGYKVEAFLFRKVQGVMVSQSPLQRRTGLASLDVALASGAVTLPFIDHATARRLCDHILFKVESTDRPWH